MTNVVPIGNTSRGFTRMDNSVMDALMKIDLPARELKVALYVAKATINFQAGTARIAAADVSKATNIHPDVASKAISHLLKRRVIFREGGARGEIGLCDPKEWVFYEGPKQTNRSDSDKQSRIVPLPRQTKTDDSLLYSKNTPNNTLPSEEVIATPADQARADEPKTERKKPFGLAQMLADNPHAIPEQLLQDWITLRKTKKAPISATVWNAMNAELVKCAEAGIDAETAMTEALMAGWQGFKVDWLVNRLEKSGRMPSRHAGPDFHSGDTSWAHDLGDDL